MNKKELNEYRKEAMNIKLKLLQGLITGNQLKNYAHFNQFPKKLFKYTTINKNTIYSIINNYVYLCPANKLDDQFECRPSFPNDILNKTESINNTFIDALSDTIDDYPDCFSKKQMKETIQKLLNYKSNNYSEKVNLNLKQDEYSEIDKMNIIKVYAAFITGKWLSKEGQELFKYLIKRASSTSDKIGICSLTENGKSQIMWEMYANKYKGICIEYDFSNSLETMVNTFPVLYGDNEKTKILYTIINICIEIFNYSYANVNNLVSIGYYINMFLIKYNEWSFQKEWRIIGNKCSKINVPKIKKIYLGKNISNKNKEKIIQIAKNNNIELYEQLDNFETLEIKYQKLHI